MKPRSKMPVIKLQHVVSSSSEDTTHKADNLLKPESYRKWKCAEDADRKASVILQFEKASQIHSIDIGNDHSAFVEVLVGHSTSTSSDDYQVILVTSSFMSPMDSKNGINTNRVRMFGPDKLSKAVLAKKWDRVKVICSQPFNKLTSYGLSFIKFHSPPEKTEESSSPSQSDQQSVKKLGIFRMKEDTKSTSLTAGSYFKQRSITKTEPAPLTGAAAVRAAATLAAASLKTSVSTSQSTLTPGPTTTTTTTTNQVRPSINSTHKPTDKLSDRPQKMTQKRRLSDEDSAPSQTPGDTRNAAARRNTADREQKKTTAPPSKKSRDNDDDTSRKKKSSKPFERLMEGVTFVLSGFQNPLRGDLRDKAMEMGAKYKPDWGKGCTHLVCAFANTPKFNQVQGKGKIVTKGWILDSYKKKLLHPWRRYSMVSTSDDSSSYEEESETEDEEDWEPNKRRRAPPKKATPNKAMPKTATPRVDTPVNAQAIDKDKTEAVAASSMADQETHPTGAAATAGSVTSTLAAATNDDCSTTDIESDDGEKKVKPKASNLDDISSGGDTEDEVRRIQENKIKAKSSSKDPYDSSTDEETNKTMPDPSGSSFLSAAIPDLPDFFAEKVFFLYGKFEAEERRQLTRLIVAFEGTVEDYMSDQVIFVVTNADWDDNFDKALSDHPGLTFVRPKWIYSCSEKSKKVPYQPYVIVPS